MVNRWLTYTLTTLLVASLFSLVLVSVFRGTVFQAKYVEKHLAEVDGYNRLSGALSSEVAKQAGVQNNPQLSAVINHVLQPSVLQQKLNVTLDQYQQFYEGKGEVPQLDLTDIAAQLQSQGVPLPANTDISQPIALASPDDKGTQNVGKAFAYGRNAALVLSIVLTLALVLVGWRTHKYTPIPNVLILVGIFVGLVALALWLGPGFARRYIQFINGGNAFVELGRDLTQNIGRDLAARFGIIFAVFEVVGIPLRIYAGRLERKNRPIPQYG